MSIDMETLKKYCDEQYNVLLSGKHGVGKTAIVKEIFNEKFGEHNVKWKYFSASTLDPWVDFIGIPKNYTNADGKEVFSIIPPEHFTGDEDIKAIFIDEINRADDKTLNALMELIQFKSINGRKFKNLKVIWAAENPADDDHNDYAVRELDPAQRDRFQVQIKVPYKLNEEYFTNLFGSTTFGIARSWWDSGKKEDRKQKISPRKLEDILTAHMRGHNISDFTTLVDLEDLKLNLASVSKFDFYKSIATSGDVTKIKKLFHIATLRENQNSFMTLDPKNTIFDCVYQHLDEETQNYVKRTFNYDPTKCKVMSKDQIDYIMNAKKTEYSYSNIEEVSKAIQSFNKTFELDNIFDGVMDATDSMNAFPFEFDSEDYIADENRSDLAYNLCGTPEKQKETVKFFSKVYAMLYIIAKEKGWEYAKETDIYQFVNTIGGGDDNKSNTKDGYHISVIARYNFIQKLEKGEFADITKETFSEEKLFYIK